MDPLLYVVFLATSAVLATLAAHWMGGFDEDDEEEDPAPR